MIRLIVLAAFASLLATSAQALSPAPDFSVSVMLSRNASTALRASRAERPLFWATWLTKSCLVNETLLHRGLGIRPWLGPYQCGRISLNHADLRGF